MTHPRLYFTPSDLPGLREKRAHGLHALIWRNLEESARWCLEKTPRSEWIAPVSPDPIHENLYDRFYAIMGDLAITEHLAFAFALSGEEEYGLAARNWILAGCRVWRREADGGVDGGRAYAVSRLLKGIAVGYDMVFDLLSPDERREIQETLTLIGRRYFSDYFSTPRIMDAAFHTHHAIVEFSSFGVMALALLDEIPEAREWLDLVVHKFEQHLLPAGLAPDGAQVEGATFWASTMQYRLFFMDALRRGVEKDLFGPFREYMRPEPALAGITTLKHPGYGASEETFILQPSYGQLDYCAPVFLALGREYRCPTCQRLALWDRSLGHIQKTRFVTPNGEQLLFELGGYAYVWYDPDAPSEPDEPRLSWLFRSVDEAYVRVSWNPGDLMAGARRNAFTAHAGGRAVLSGSIWPYESDSRLETLDDAGDRVVLRCVGKDTDCLEVETLRSVKRMTVRRKSTQPWTWIAHGRPERQGEALKWDDGVRARLLCGRLAGVEGFQEELRVGNGLLLLRDPGPTTGTKVTAQPDESGRIEVEIVCGTGVL